MKFKANFNTLACGKLKMCDFTEGIKLGECQSKIHTRTNLSIHDWASPKLSFRNTF